MRFTWDQGSGSFGQIEPKSVGRLEPYQRSATTMGGTTSGPSYSSAPGMLSGGMGSMNSGRLNSGMAYGGITSGGVPYGGGAPGRVNPGGGGYMGMPPMVGPGLNSGPSLGGSIRNTLGSELKKRGFFQKDGQINNLRGGFFGAKPYKSGAHAQGGEGMGAGPFSFLGSGGGAGNYQPRQIVLEAAQAGLNANGIASISPDNVFSCIANLPPPNALIGWGTGTYAAYLVDNKGQLGFLAGIMRPVGNGVYQVQFRSQVPLNHYSRVIVTLENPQHVGQVPQGPIILQVKQPPGPIRFLAPIKKAGGAVWNKVSGLVQKKPAVPEGGGNPVVPAVPVAPAIPIEEQNTGAMLNSESELAARATETMFEGSLNDASSLDINR